MSHKSHRRPTTVGGKQTSTGKTAHTEKGDPMNRTPQLSSEFYITPAGELISVTHSAYHGKVIRQVEGFTSSFSDQKTNTYIKEFGLHPTWIKPVGKVIG